MKKSIKILTVIAAIASFSFIKPDIKPRTMTVVIDAGHGGKDFGGTHDGLAEKEIVATIAEKIKSLNTNQNIVLHFTRNSDDFIGLKERAEIINTIKPDLVLSLHVNQSPDKLKSGVEIYIAKESKFDQQSNQFAMKLSDKLEKNHNFDPEIQKAPFMILKNTEAPALLIELGFLSNDADRKYLTDDVQQTRLANTILEFIAETE